MNDDIKRVIEDFNLTAKINGWNLPITDTLIRHKWPEDKPEEDGEYLVRLDTGDDVVYKVLYIVDQYTPWTNYITHWWNLPEVTE